MNDPSKCNKNKSGNSGVAKNSPDTERRPSSAPTTPLKRSIAKDTPKRAKMSMSWSPNHKPSDVAGFCSESHTQLPNGDFDFRYWEKVNRKSSIGHLNNTNSLPFVIMSYNILAQVLLEGHSYLYTYSPTEALEWNIRFKKIYREIVSINPDLLCLQEVQESHLESISSYLKELGFKFVYKKRTGIRVDGCAIFYKENLFNLLEYQTVEFFQPGVNILNRDNIGIMVKLAPKSMPDTPIVVCTTHLLYNPKRIDVRLAQVQTFFGEIDKFAYHEGDGEGKYYPIILTGDFNSHPDNPVNKYIVNGQIKSDKSYATSLREIGITDCSKHLGVHLQRSSSDPLEMHSLSMLYHSEEDENKQHRHRHAEIKNSKEHNRLFNNEYITHDLNFTSVYPHVKSDLETEASTFQNEWVTVDYIYYSSNNENGNLQLLERFRLPTANECCRLDHLPNHILGSDHLSLAAKFVLVKVLPVSKV